MSNPILQSYTDKWLAAHPAQQLSLSFLNTPQRDIRLALAALEQELVTAAYGISEPQVAATKLNWWAEELGGAIASGGRHPLTQTLFADETVRQIDASLWLAPVMAALRQLDDATAGDFAAQLAAAEAFHGALAALETRIWFGARAEPARAARVASLDHLLHALTRLKENASAERLPLPMARLARHGLDRESLTDDSPHRREAVHEQLVDLLDAWQEAFRLPGPLSIFRGLDARLDQRWTRQALRARQPLARLRHMQEHQAGFATLRLAWSAARACRAVRID